MATGATLACVPGICVPGICYALVPEKRGNVPLSFSLSHPILQAWLPHMTLSVG